MTQFRAWPPPEPMSEKMILERTHSFWLDVVREFGADHLLHTGTNFDEVYEAIIYPKHEIILEKNQYLGVDDLGSPILGMYLPKENVAIVDKGLIDSQDSRTCFVEWHEVCGHGVFQGQHLRKVARGGDRLHSTPESMFGEIALERQANKYAANVAAPLNFVYAIYAKTFGIRHKIRFCGPRKYSLSVNGQHWPVYAGSPLALARIIAKRIRYYFGGLSIEALSYQVLRVAIDQNGYNQGERFPSKTAIYWDALESLTMGDK